jgi:hypothetical protein
MQTFTIRLLTPAAEGIRVTYSAECITSAQILAALCEVEHVLSSMSLSEMELAKIQRAMRLSRLAMAQRVKPLSGMVNGAKSRASVYVDYPRCTKSFSQRRIYKRLIARLNNVSTARSLVNVLLDLEDPEEHKEGI